MTLNASAVQRAADAAAAGGRFLGGPAGGYAGSGRRALRQCVAHGLQPDSTLIDVGCGALRAGIWLIDYLDPYRYCGIEPSDAYLATGRSIARAVLGDTFELRKRPRFDDNDRFDLSVFGETPDVVLATGVLNHAAKRHIALLLDGFVAVAHRESVLLVTVRLACNAGEDYLGDQWAGRSHERDQPATVYHRREWIDDAARTRGLTVADIGQFGDKGPRWLRVRPVE